MSLIKSYYVSRPKKAEHIYVNKHFEATKRLHPCDTKDKIIRRVKRAWNNLSADLKNIYFELEKQDVRRYETEVINLKLSCGKDKLKDARANLEQGCVVNKSSSEQSKTTVMKTGSHGEPSIEHIQVSDIKVKSPNNTSEKSENQAETTACFEKPSSGPSNNIFLAREKFVKAITPVKRSLEEYEAPTQKSSMEKSGVCVYMPFFDKHNKDQQSITKPFLQNFPIEQSNNPGCHPNLSTEPIAKKPRLDILDNCKISEKNLSLGKSSPVEIKGLIKTSCLDKISAEQFLKQRCLSKDSFEMAKAGKHVFTETCHTPAATIPRYLEKRDEFPLVTSANSSFVSLYSLPKGYTPEKIETRSAEPFMEISNTTLPVNYSSGKYQLPSIVPYLPNKPVEKFAIFTKRICLDTRSTVQFPTSSKISQLEKCSSEELQATKTDCPEKQLSDSANKYTMGYVASELHPDNEFIAERINPIEEHPVVMQTSDCSFDKSDMVNNISSDNAANKYQPYGKENISITESAIDYGKGSNVKKDDDLLLRILKQCDIIE